MKDFLRHMLIMLTAGLMLAGLPSFAQVKAMTMSEADSAMEGSPKPLLILLSAEWCRFCGIQKNQLDRNKEFAANAGNGFYYAELDVETGKSIHFNGQDYRFKPNGGSSGINELAEALNGSGQMALPCWVLLDSQFRILFRHGGVLGKDELNELINDLRSVTGE